MISRTSRPLEAQNLPSELRERRQWVGWRSEVRAEGKKPTKVPVDVAAGGNASATDPSTWADFSMALRAFRDAHVDGIGYVFSDEDPYVGVDLDGCRDPETGFVESWAEDIVDTLASYTEVSPSGTGLHIITRGSLPPVGRRRGAVEMYEAGRYFTMTGWVVSDRRELYERTEELFWLHARTFAAPGQGADPRMHIAADDGAIIARARAAANGAKFSSLWSGDATPYTSQSEADLALCSILSFHVGRDRSRIDALFRRSGLMRPKWDEQHGQSTYGEMTIGKALTGMTPERLRGHCLYDASTINPHPLTDAGNAELFAALFGEDVRYDHRRQQWLVWGGHRWESDSNGEVVRLAKTAARARLRAAADLDDEERRSRAAKWAVISESLSRIEACLELAKSEFPIADVGDAWNRDPWLVGVTNGVIDLRTGLLRPGHQADRVTMQIPVRYEADAKCPRWSSFLDEVFVGQPEIIAFIQRAIGYCITGLVTEQVIFLCHGGGANGKTVFLNVLRRALGDYAINLPFSVLELSQRSAIPNDIAQLVGRRLATSAETNESTRLNEARIKSLTGGDPITARFLYAEPFTFEPSAKFWLAVNHLPIVQDDSHGFWRRVRVLPFLQSFEGDAADRDLFDKLQAELPGIFAWAVRGCLKWQKDGLAPPDLVVDATRAYKEESDDFTRFVSDCCELDPQATSTPKALHDAYVQWAVAEGIAAKEQLSSKMFGLRMKTRFEQAKSGPRRHYRGVRLSTHTRDG